MKRILLTLLLLLALSQIKFFASTISKTEEKLYPIVLVNTTNSSNNHRGGPDLLVIYYFHGYLDLTEINLESHYCVRILNVDTGVCHTYYDDLRLIKFDTYSNQYIEISIVTSDDQIYVGELSLL